MKTKSSKMIEAIRNFHKVYYEISGDSLEDHMRLHHAAEHLFDAAEITSSINPKGSNDEIWQDIQEGKKPNAEVRKAWKKINKSNSK